MSGGMGGATRYAPHNPAPALVIDGYHYARNRNRLNAPASLTHAVLSAIALVAFVVGGLVWMGVMI